MDRTFYIRAAQNTDIDALHRIEMASFEFDQLSKRRFKHWVSAGNAIFLVACDNNAVVAYALGISRKGSRCTRLYSIAVDQCVRGQKLGEKLLMALEAHALLKGAFFMRLEVAVDNHHAISLYKAQGYKQFGIYKAYYENKVDALRMQKAIKQVYTHATLSEYPWYPQSTEFSCGPASLMMAAASLKTSIPLNQHSELDIWREATSIYMNSGQAGSHPIGLALAALAYGLQSEVYLNIQQTPFIDSVRSPHKKALLDIVHAQFYKKAKEQGLRIRHEEPNIEQLREALAAGKALVCLISTYQFDGKKIPHWVAITHIDDTCLYLHDPDIDEQDNPMDYQHIPIAIEDFTSMATFGKQKLRTCIVLSKPCI
jgi:ribosomal protein S18 acetylase RimI-like enzyme